ADAVSLMSRNVANMIPILEKMTPELMAMAQQSGIIWSQDDIDRSRTFNVAVSEVEQSVANIATRIGIELLPALSDMIAGFAKSPDFINAVVSTTDAFAH